MNVNAIAFSPPPLSLSMIQRHDLWFVSVFQDHPSSAGSAAAPPVVNHSESLSLISINRSSVALWSPPPSTSLLFFILSLFCSFALSVSLSLFLVSPPLSLALSFSLSHFSCLPPLLFLPPPRCTTYCHAGYRFRAAASSAYLLFNKLTTCSRAMNKKVWALIVVLAVGYYTPPSLQFNTVEMSQR